VSSDPTKNPKTPVLEACGIGKHYQGQWLFHSWNAVLEPGQGLALTGANGSGKSTLLQCIGGLIRPDIGIITWGGEKEQMPACSLSAPYLDIPTEYTLNELVTFHFSINPLKSGADPFLQLRLCHLDPTSNLLLKHYSSGMIQKVKLVLALLTDAPILLLDEPHSHLDREAQAWFQQLLSTSIAGRIWAMASNDPNEYRLCSAVFDLGSHPH
jgi:ABC-type multidrug transport system ATPase subunit